MIRMLSILLLLCLNTAAAENHASPYYTVYRTWALAPPGSESPGKIISFLPRRYLLYIENRDETVSFADADYVRATTQDGADVLVFEQNISRKTFKESIGEHEVIFNTLYQLCKTMGCEPDEITATPVERGDSFKIVEKDSGFYKLEGTRPDGNFQGYISKQRLAGMKSIGQVTRVDDPHPRYVISKRKSSALGTTCNDQRAANTKWAIADGDDATARILERINLGVVEGGEVRMQRPLGEAGMLYRFFLYSIEDREQPPDSDERIFHVAAAFKIHCQVSDLGSVMEDYIDSVTFVSDRRDEEVTFTIDEFGTPRDLHEYTGDAYMISVNSENHFNKALELLSVKIADRTLAGYVRTEINRSCRSAERKAGSNGPCLEYDY